MYLLIGTCYSEGKIQQNGNAHLFLYQIYEEKLVWLFLTGSWSFCVHLVGLNQIDSKIERFESTPVDHLQR